MIAALLNFLFLILLAVFIVVGIVAYKIYRTVHSVKKQFNSFKGKEDKILPAENNTAVQALKKK